MLAVNNISVEFSSKPLISNASFIINDNDKIGLVGKNGAGKTTLLNLMAGLSLPSSGSISRSGDLTIGYLPQHLNFNDDTSLINEVKKIYGDRDKLEKDLTILNEKIESSSDFESDEYHNLLEKVEHINTRLSYYNPAKQEAEIEKTLLGLGFKRSDFHKPTNTFSGGWRMRIELAKILLQSPNLLLLDEPTNHLDIESIQWLENYLVTKANAVVLVSHDRAFLDNVTKRTIEISCRKIYDYKVNYSKFKELRKERIEQQLRAYENQQKLIAETKDFIEKFRYKATKAVQVQSRIKQLEKIVPIEVDEVDASKLNLKFPPAERSGDFPAIIENLSKSYG